MDRSGRRFLASANIVSKVPPKLLSMVSAPDAPTRIVPPSVRPAVAS